MAEHCLRERTRAPNVGRCGRVALATLLAAGCALPEATKNQAASASSASGAGGSGGAGGAAGGSGGTQLCAGELDWLKVVGDVGEQRLTAFAVHPDGLAAAGVYTGGATDFGNGPLPTSTAPYDNLFVTTFDQAASPIQSRAIDANGTTLNAFGIAVSGGTPPDLVLVGEHDAGFEVDRTVGLGGTEGQVDAYALRFDGLELAPDTVSSYVGRFAEHFQRTVFDGSGRLLVSGWIDDSITLPSGALTATGGDANFVARLDEPAWSLALDTNSGRDRITDIAVADGDGVVIAGTYYKDLDVGAEQLPLSSLANAFVARLDEAGSVLWAQGYGGEALDTATVSAVEVSPDGAIAVVGWFTGRLELGAAAGETLDSNGNTDIFVAVFESHGALRWAKSFGGPQYEDAHDVVFDGCGAIVVVGAFTGEVDFDGDVRTSVANDSPVLIALDALGGTRRWVRVLGVPGFVSACPASHVDASPCYVLGRTTDAVYLAGSFRGALGFDGSDVRPASDLDIFMAKITAH
ncbi:MAG: hypothetical protein WKG00_30985 [Polyangiaceae bacterium]